MVGWRNNGVAELLLIRGVLLASVGPSFVEFESKVELCKF